ncbi:hypothetical protein D3C84_1035840 [compost metagenome]
MIRLIDGERRIVPGPKWLAPGLTSTAVHGYFDFADNFQVATKPLWYDLCDISDAMEPTFHFEGFLVTPDDPGHDYLMQYYADFVRDFLDQSRSDY